MYIKQEQRQPQYEFVIEALRKGFMGAVAMKDKSHIGYVLLRGAVMAWLDLGGGYNNGSDIKAILRDVLDEFTVRIAHSLKQKKDKYGDITNPIKLPDIDTLDLKKTKPSIVDPKGKPLTKDNIWWYSKNCVY